MSSQTNYVVPSTMRAMRILEFLAHSKRGASISDLSRNLGLPKSSTYLVLKTLEREGYLRRSLRSGKFSFGARILDLCRSVVGDLDLREVAKASMAQLMKQTGMTVHLAVLEGNQAVIIDRAEAPGRTAGADWVSRRLDVNCTGVGKALAAFLPEEQFEAVVNAQRFARHNDNTIVAGRALRRELLKVRAQGWALDDEEDEIGVRCVGVPILDSNHQALAAISLAGTTEEMPLDRVHFLVLALKQTASVISQQLATSQNDFRPNASGQSISSTAC